jgi:hypothetical protein
MPDGINYSKLNPILSPARIDSYARFFTNHSEKEIYGVYLWNMALCGAIYPLLQALEVSLRNAVNRAAKAQYGDYWHEKLPFVEEPTKKNADIHDKLYQQLNKSEKDLIRAKNKVLRQAGKRHLPKGYRPCFDDVVANTNFSVWEYALHPCHFKNDKSFLWPNKSKKAFFNWPVRSSKETHTIIYDIIAEIRPFRNRLSHNEPLWKGAGMTNEKAALKFLNQKINKIHQLLFIISDEKCKLLRVSRLVEKAKYLASKKALDSYRYREKVEVISLKHKKKVRHLLQENHRQGHSKVYSYGGMNIKIERSY